MKFSIKTDKFKEMVSRSIKGASCNKLIPLTSLMSVELKKKTLTLITTDSTNYLYIRENKVEGEDFYVTVPVDTFSKLISRMTCETISLEVKDGSLEVSGNGKYLIELPQDENGDMIKFPDPLAKVKASPLGEIKSTTIATILNTAKPALATTLEIPCYTGYYVGEKVIATDTYKICGINERLLKDDCLISPEMMNLLAVMTTEKISVDSKDDILIFSSPDCVVYGPIMDGIEDFQIDAITGLLESEFPSKCKFAKSAILQLLDRLSLFVNEDYDKSGIFLTFTKEGLIIRSKSSSGEELIPYHESDNFKDFVGCINIGYLQSLVKAQVSDMVEMHYGEENAIKMIDGNVIQIIALMDEDESDID